MIQERFINEPPLGVIPEQGACPPRPKGARSKAKNKEGARCRKRAKRKGKRSMRVKTERSREQGGKM